MSEPKSSMKLFNIVSVACLAVSLTYIPSGFSKEMCILISILMYGVTLRLIGGTVDKVWR